MSVQFPQNSYLECYKAANPSVVLNTDRELYDHIKAKPLQYGLCHVPLNDYLVHNRDKTRKNVSMYIDIKRCIHSLGYAVKHLSIAFFDLIKLDFTRSQVHFLYTTSHLEIAFGSLISIFHEKLGAYLCTRACFNGTAYNCFISPPPTRFPQPNKSVSAAELAIKFTVSQFISFSEIDKKDFRDSYNFQMSEQDLTRISLYLANEAIDQDKLKIYACMISEEFKNQEIPSDLEKVFSDDELHSLTIAYKLFESMKDQQQAEVDFSKFTERDLEILFPEITKNRPFNNLMRDKVPLLLERCSSAQREQLQALLFEKKIPEEYSTIISGLD